MIWDRIAALTRAHGPAALRGAAAGFGLFLLANVTGELVRPGFDASWLALSLVPLPAAVRPLALLGLGLILCRWAWAPLRRQQARRIAVGVTAGAAALAALDAVRFWAILAAGGIETPAVVPGSCAIALGLGLIARSIAREDAGRRAGAVGRPAWLAGALAVAAALPLTFMLTFGPTRYARPADCAVVLGARVYRDGTPSLALADRVDEGVRLYRAGLVHTLIMSGGVDPRHGRSEAVAMRDRAVAAGVPASAILLDEAGDTSADTARNATAMMRARGLRSALVVSHYYHQPRLRLLFARSGVRAYGVPATMSRRLAKEPWFLARETAAFYKALLLDA